MIPSVTESQVKLMSTVCTDPNMSVFSQTSSKDGDGLIMSIAMDEAQRDADYLVSLGFLKNITSDHLEQIAKVNAETGRTWRVFEITAMARAMFQAYTSTTVH